MTKNKENFVIKLCVKLKLANFASFSLFIKIIICFLRIRMYVYYFYSNIIFSLYKFPPLNNFKKYMPGLSVKIIF